jgi:hypothetical protein
MSYQARAEVARLVDEFDRAQSPPWTTRAGPGGVSSVDGREEGDGGAGSVDHDFSRDCVTVHARRGDKLFAKTAHSDPHDPAFQQAPGFNRSFGFYVDQAVDMLGKIGSKSKTIFFMTDDNAWLQVRSTNTMPNL